MKTTNEQLAYTLFRITMGITMLGHGLVRIPKIAIFRDGMLKAYAGVLPEALVSPFATVLPFVEFIIGALLIAGLFTRYAIIAGALLMMVLIFGCCMKENWEVVGSQLVYGFLYYILLRFLDHNRYALDNLAKK